MSDKMAEYLKNELEKKGQEIEEEVVANKEVSDAKAPDDMYEKIALRIANYEAQKAAYEHLSKEDQEALIRGRELMMLEREENREDVLYEKIQNKRSVEEPRIGTRRRYRIQRKKKVIIAFAAVLILLFTMSMTSIGSKQYILQVVNKILKGGDIVQMDTKGDRMYSENKDESEAYEKIEEELGINVVELTYKPPEMIFDDYVIKENMPWANIFYLYNNKYVVTYRMGLTYRDASFGWRRGDRLIDEYEITVARNIINVKKYEVQNSKQIVCVAEYHDNNTYYMLAGMIDEKEFEKIVENIHFY
ncbi:DUF4367 domain-containing protein [Lachnospiraceae bacterium LCP25S3_G4]